MLDLIVNLATLAVVALLILWCVWAVVKRFWPATAASQTGQVIEQITDKSQDFAALAALRAIRWMNEVESSPEALLAWDTLYRTIGGKTPPKQVGGWQTAVTRLEYVPAEAKADSTPTKATPVDQSQADWTPEKDG